MSIPITPVMQGKPRAQLQVRRAEQQDARDIARIYLQAIQDHLATFENFLGTPEERTRWVTDHAGKFPLLVADLNGRVLGWASLSPYQVRPRIEGIAELLIYIDRDYRRHGVGRELMRAIQSAGRKEGHCKLIGRFVAHNDAGRTLCRMTGWREVGVHEKHTRLDGRWHDVVVVEFLITENLK
ncbi:MAG: N-acetyltransferase family protein [Terriglobia bacterium]